MYRIPRGDISPARRFIDNKQEGVYPVMAKESVWTKLRRKVDKEFAEELQRQQEMERTAREEAKALEKQQKKEAAIAAYREKRDLTVADFFRIADLPLPDDFADIADHTISDFTADPRRLTPDSIFLYWGKSPISAGDPASVLQMAIGSGCLCVISNKPDPRSLYQSLCLYPLSAQGEDHYGDRFGRQDLHQGDDRSHPAAALQEPADLQGQ